MHHWPTNVDTGIVSCHCFASPSGSDYGTPYSTDVCERFFILESCTFGCSVPCAPDQVAPSRVSGNTAILLIRNLPLGLVAHLLEHAQPLRSVCSGIYSRPKVLQPGVMIVTYPEALDTSG
jgi:hypothetical protein